MCMWGGEECGGVILELKTEEPVKIMIKCVKYLRHWLAQSKFSLVSTTYCITVRNGSYSSLWADVLSNTG